MGIFAKIIPQIIFLQTRNVSYQKLKTWYGKLVIPRPQDPPYTHITQIGDPVLRVKSDPVPQDSINSPEIKFLIKQMSNVFNEYKCIGLSATQLGIPLRVFMMELNKRHLKDYNEDEIKNKEISLVPKTIVINPEVKITDYTKVVYFEACLSVRGFFADVMRYRGVELTGFDENGHSIVINAKGWTARIIQHELDHLNGKLYTDIMDKKSLTCSCWEVINERRGKVMLPYGPE